MIEEILPDLYRLDIPIPENHLGAINCYAVKGKERSLVIDTGMNQAKCLEVITSGLKKLGIDLSKTDFFITHRHSDHSGLASTLPACTSKVYASKTDAEAINTNDFSLLKKQRAFAELNGFPEEATEMVARNHPAYKYGSRQPLVFSIVEDNYEIEVGGYNFRCIVTPGHTQGHVCLFEPRKKFFLSGDHILSDITPTIVSFAEDRALSNYLESLEKVYVLDVTLVLPGHRRPFKNFRERIKELQQHHQARAGEVVAILREGTQNAYQVASQMTWDMDYERWDEVQPLQKWLATGEAISHLHYLEERGRVVKRMQGQKPVFSLS